MTLALTSGDSLRVVPDVSWLVSALLSPDGPAGRALRRFLEHEEFELVLTEPIVDELRRTLSDRRVKRHLKIDARDISRLTTAITWLATFVEVEAESEGDAKYVAAARVAAPCLWVTFDPEGVKSQIPEDVEMVSPRVLLELLEMAPARGNPAPLPAFR